MQALSRKGFVLAGMMIAGVPALVAQALPYGMKQSSPAVNLKAAAKPSAETKAFNGQYVFSVHGATVGGQAVSHEEGIAGSIIADGKGNIISGVEDFNSSTGTFTQLPVTGTYALDANGSGTLTLVTGQMTQTFAIYAALTGTKIKSATLVQADGVAATSGVLVKQSPTDVIDGNYSFNMSGETFETSGNPDSVAVSGNFNVIPGFVQGLATIVLGDIAGGDVIVSPPFVFPATMTTPDANGRFTLTFSFVPGDNTAPQSHFVGYVVDAKHFNLMPTDAPSDFSPLITGSAVQ